MEQLWQAGGEVAGLPSADIEPIPPKPWYGSDKDPAPNVLKQWKKEAAEVYLTRVKTRSKRISAAMKMVIANKFKEDKAIYFVWTADFRGRLYPISAYVQPQSDDTGRALLRFAEGKTLTKEGAYWLAVHGANCFGNDKISYMERYKWVTEREQDIYDVAMNPYDNTWWQDADEPFQFLAFCFEWSRWMDYGLECVSYLPVSMDGTCNGLQHLSALILDGSAPVNLTPGPKPQDIYQEVADVIDAQVKLDAAKGNPLAQQWMGKVTRKTAKRAVMTTPYGLKPYGLRQQLVGDLEKIEKNYLGEGDTFPAIDYYADECLKAIGQVVKASKEVMDWVQTIAKVMNKAKLPVCWTTPSGFLVHQESVKSDAIRMATWFGEQRIRITMKEMQWDKLNTRGQVSGISPNFIHSLDASHLMSILNAWGGSITTVHDSIGTHASSVAELHKVIRATFVKMYSTNQLERFRKEIIAQLPPEFHSEVPLPPQQGDLDIKVVENSPYFFA
jgi:DNA-directed RNA polymerase